jgi:hypothetical protein
LRVAEPFTKVGNRTALSCRVGSFTRPM